MQNIEKIGFIFTNQELNYLCNGVQLNIDMLYKSTVQGDTNSTTNKEDDISG